MEKSIADESMLSKVRRKISVVFSNCSLCFRIRLLSK